MQQTEQQLGALDRGGQNRGTDSHGGECDLERADAPGGSSSGPTDMDSSH